MGGWKNTYAGRRRPVQCAIGLIMLAWVLMASALAGTAMAATARPAPAPQDAAGTVLVMGDSLSAAYGMAADEGWVSLLGERLASRAPAWRVVNASISGETTAGGASRIVDALARHRPDVVVIALGANDGLRGLPTHDSAINLARMIGAAHGAGAEVLLVGMQMPPNLGAAYTRAFEQNYRNLADRFDVALLPFLLEPIALDRDAFQDDNLHPVAEVQPRLLDHVWPSLEPLLD